MQELLTKRRGPNAAEAHGGSIHTVNLPGKECVFVVKLPQELRQPWRFRCSTVWIVLSQSEFRG